MCFCLLNTVVFSCFFHFGRMLLSLFCEICGRVGNENVGSKKIFGHGKVGSVGQKTVGAHVLSRHPQSLSARGPFAISTVLCVQLARQPETLHDFILVFISKLHYILGSKNIFHITRFGLCRIIFFTARFGFYMLSRTGTERGPHHTDQSENITSFGTFRINYRHPTNYITIFVPTSINYELHEIALHFLTR